MSRCLSLAALSVACALVRMTGVAHAAEWRCLGNAQCRNPDSVGVLLRPGVSEVILDANFGLVYPAAQGGWQYTCDDIFVGRIPNRTQIASDGRVFVPASDGLYVSGDGCDWTKGSGALAGQNVY